MTRHICVFAIALLSSIASGDESAVLPAKLLGSGWIQLFDGQSLFGWNVIGDAKWEVHDGELRTNGDQPGFLMTTTRWADYELHIEFRAPAETNSGVFLRTAAEPRDPASDCYELNIAPADNPFPTGSIVARQKTELPADKAPSPDEWHTFKVTAWGGWITAELDGQRVIGFTDKSPLRTGYIGLQSNHGSVAFRNVRLRPIVLQALLTSGNLSNFNTKRAEESKFTITKRKELHLTGGPGQIETNDDFTNFILQLECKVNGDGLNSGVFFRTLREGRWGGYESQIQNGFKNGDRTQPVDFGTGGIYRRQPARRILPNDREWFYKTIVADGAHMAVWVNGIQVSDWTDTRPPKENAREGLRLGGGAIAIQGHDATTDFSFRNFRVAELPR